MLSEQVLAQWWHPVASSETLDLLHWAMRTVTYCRIAMASKRPAKWVYMFIVLYLNSALVAAGAIGSKWLPNGGFQGYLVCPLICCIR